MFIAKKSNRYFFSIEERKDYIKEVRFNTESEGKRLLLDDNCNLIDNPNDIF